MEIILSLFFGLLFACLTAYVAAKRQRRASLWFLFGFLGGLFGLLIVLLLPSSQTPVEGDILNDFLTRNQKKSLPLKNYPPYHEKQWYYVNQERKATGPIPLEELQYLYTQGVITDSTLLWYEGLAAWQPLKELDGLMP